MLSSLRFIIGAILAGATLYVSALGLLATARLKHMAKAGPIEVSRHLLFDDRADWNQFYDPTAPAASRSSRAGRRLPNRRRPRRLRRQALRARPRRKRPSSPPPRNHPNRVPRTNRPPRPRPSPRLSRASRRITMRAVLRIRFPQVRAPKPLPGRLRRLAPTRIPPARQPLRRLQPHRLTRLRQSVPWNKHRTRIRRCRLEMMATPPPPSHPARVQTKGSPARRSGTKSSP